VKLSFRAYDPRCRLSCHSSAEFMLAAVEDPLSDAVVRRTLSLVRPDLVLWSVMGHRGNGYLRSKCRELNQTARSVPVLLLTDQDDPSRCAPALIADWLPVPKNPRLIFRVATMEIESWVMADRAAFAALLGVSASRVPLNTDAIDQPKEFLVDLARRARRRELRLDLVPAEGATTPVGPAYNARLSDFVTTTWDPHMAAETSPSLARMLAALQGIA
jgi:hypothetical protein